MSHTINHLKQIKTKDIKLKNKLKLSNSYEIIPLQYLSQDLIFQTPKMSLPFGITCFHKQEFLRMSFSNSVNDPQLIIFQNLINNLNIYLNKCISEILDSKSYSFINPLDRYKNFPYMLSTKIFNNSSENLLIFDQYKTKLDLEQIHKNDYCKSILYISNIWINHDTFRWGYDIYVLQLKIYTIYRKLSEYSFIEDDEDHRLLKSQVPETRETFDSNLIKIESHPKYKKYFKMLSFGVPKENIRSQMIIDGVDVKYLEYSSDYLIAHNTEVHSSKQETKFNVQELLLNKSKLKKMTINTTASKKKDKKTIFSLEDILKRIKSLRKTNINLA